MLGLVMVLVVLVVCSIGRGGGIPVLMPFGVSHRLCKGLVRLAGDGSEGHGTGVKALHDLADRLHLLQRDGQGRLVLEAEETPVYIYFFKLRK